MEKFRKFRKLFKKLGKLQKIFKNFGKFFLKIPETQTFRKFKKLGENFYFSLKSGMKITDAKNVDAEKFLLKTDILFEY